MQYEIVVVGDYNDADYVTAINEISEVDIARFEPVFKAIKNRQAIDKYGAKWPKNWWGGGETFNDLYPEFFEDEDQDLYDTLIGKFDDMFVPSCEDGVHSIDKIYYYPLPSKTVVI
jgi:hypothetical protein